MSRMKLFALEDEMIDDVDETTGGEAAAAAAVAEEVETEASSIEETASSVEDGVDAIDNLEEVKDVMDQSVETGTGLDPVAAEMARISIRNILSKIGAESHANALMVASESFGSTSSRLANTRYASEGVGSFIANVWEKIKIFFSNMWNKVRDFVVGLFNKEKAIKDAVKRVEKKLGDVEMASKKKNIATKGKLGGFVYTSRKKLATYNDVVSFIVEQQASVDTLAKLNSDLKTSADKALSALNSRVSVNGTSSSAAMPKLNNLTFTSSKAGPFYGGNVVEIEKSSPTSDSYKIEVVKTLNILSMVDSTHFKAEEFELTNSVSDLKKLMSDVTKFIDGKSSSKKEGKILTDDLEKILKDIKKTISLVQTKNDKNSDSLETNKEDFSSLVKAVQKNMAIVNKSFSFLTASNFKLAAAAIYYAEVCMFENSDYYVSKTEKDD